MLSFFCDYAPSENCGCKPRQHHEQQTQPSPTRRGGGAAKCPDCAPQGLEQRTPHFLQPNSARWRGCEVPRLRAAGSRCPGRRGGTGGEGAGALPLSCSGVFLSFCQEIELTSCRFATSFFELLHQPTRPTIWAGVFVLHFYFSLAVLYE